MMKLRGITIIAKLHILKQTDQDELIVIYFEMVVHHLSNAVLYIFSE